MKRIAHIRETDQAIQTVEQHCKETAALAAKYAASASLAKNAEIAGLLHDIGKLTADFNAYIQGNSKFTRGALDHSFAGAKYLRLTASQSENKMLKQTAALIGKVIISHHGLHDWINEDAKDTYQLRTDKEAYYAEIIQNLQEAAFLPDMETLLSEAASEYAALRAKIQAISPDGEAFAFYLGMLERLLQSVLIDADRTNTADFMSGSRTESEYVFSALRQEMRCRMQEKLDSFAEKTDPISMQRKSISERCASFAAHDTGICRLIVPTGGGKTLSSLRFAIEYAYSHPVERIFYIAPFMSILEQNSDVIREISGDAAFLEHHSDMLAEVSEDDCRLHEYELRTEKWDAPVIATTMVQFLNALFSGRSSAVRRMHRLSNAVIIIDEVQSIPLKCVYLFNLAVNFLAKICGSTIVLCSATQPPFEHCREFPLLLDENGSMTGDTEKDFAVFRRTKLSYPQKTGGYSFDEAADFCRKAFAENGSLLLVVNTKSAAKELYQRLRDTENASVFHLSTNMCPQHRRERIAGMKRALSAHEPIICVTTQLIEAGVDISFGCVVRSLAGMDNAAQAAGRCNRNGEYHMECPVYLLQLYEEHLGSLAEIKEAQDISVQMLMQNEDADYLSVPLMSDYFGKLYQNARHRRNRNLLRYPLPETADADLINLLAINRNRTKRNPNLKYCGQAFKTAGRLFQVIDSYTADIIVPYDKHAAELIAKLETEQNPKETLKLLRQAQKYAVSVYAGTESKLHHENAVRTVICGQKDVTVQVLEKRFYNGDFGVTTEGGEQEILIL